MGYGRYDEGVALISLGRKIEQADQFPISKSLNYQNWKTRRVLGVKLAGLEDYSVEEYPKFPSSMDQLLEMLGGGQKTDDARVRALVGDDMFQMYKAARDASQVKEARVMARVPYGMRLEF